ncbi:phosphatidate cytidylyltransferase [Aromatoleum petrolei]|uniref:Phosphatidate cytidylyltransferase n=1 Tax=Aromatoleum petrolei TaxID=76116 RepID=A0ABX1MXK0_9RHOO|nr:phosphatidate cytidylyltransferase [Aromatoleum petrolei]NMF91288.1 phosphatidate cytidylyltransferase [Aromatoleum petrolei]QTQ34309.1 Phosphatidate cytidylyltransferase family protein [Aromatoleum petrolei]
MLKTRIITAFVLLGVLLGALFLLPPVGWLAFASLICAGAAWEWGGLARFTGARRLSFAVLMGAACFLLGAVAGLASDAPQRPVGLFGFYGLSAAFWLAVVPFWLQRKWHLQGNAGGMLVGLIVLLPPALAMAHLRSVSPLLLLAVIAAVSIADISAYFTGRAFGRRKLAPEISPGKTWEGAGGAVAGVTVFGLVLALGSSLAIARTPLVAGLLPLLAGFTAVSIIGDLFESLLKRQAGLKDSGTLLPGHGGILDRIDSLTSTLPLVGLAALWFAN